MLEFKKNGTFTWISFLFCAFLTGEIRDGGGGGADSLGQSFVRGKRDFHLGWVGMGILNHF